MTTPSEGRSRRGLISLIADVPRLIIELLQAEIASLKAEISSKLKSAGIGAGLLVGAGVFGGFHALVVPAWAAALIVAGALLVLAALIGLIGYGQLKRGVPLTPTETIDSVKEDVRAIRGLRKRENS